MSVVFVRDNVRLILLKKVASTSLQESFCDPDTVRVSDQDGKPPYLQTAVIIRHPLSRIHSLWRNQFLDVPRDNMFSPRLAGKGFKHGMSFTEFTDYVCHVPDREADHHFRSQWREIWDLMEPELPQHLLWIAQLEQIEDCWPNLAAWAQLKLKPLHKRNASKSEHDLSGERYQNVHNLIDRYWTDLQMWRSLYRSSCGRWAMWRKDFCIWHGNSVGPCCN